VVGDATFFGKRKYKNQRGVLVFRDSKEKENLIWKHLQTEKIEDYLQLKLFLEKKGYEIDELYPKRRTLSCPSFGVQFIRQSSVSASV